MDLLLDLIVTLSRWSRSHLYDISLAIMATLLVLFGPGINAWVQRSTASMNFILRTLIFVLVCAASHPLLDAMTSGGLGVALAWPWSEHRFFAPWRPIRVSPFAPQFFSARGVATLLSELRWVWLPLAGAVVAWKLIQPAPAAPRDPS